MIPDTSDPRWKRVLTNESDLSSTSLATRILVSRLRRDVQGSAAALPGAVSELRAFMAKNSFAQADMQRF